MVRKTLSLLTLILSCAVLSAQEKVYPYYWLNLGITEDLSTTAVVSWRSPVDFPVGKAQIAPVLNTPNIEKYAKDADVTDGHEMPNTEDSKRHYPEEYYHRAVFSGLQPGTSYLYRVGDGKVWSEWNEFRTAEAGNQPFRFIYLGDVQTGFMDIYPRLARKACTIAPDAAFVTFVGDLVGDRRHGNYSNFFDGNDWMLKQIPVAAVADGHEHFTDDEGSYKMVHLWKNMFAYPENAPELSREEGIYYFDYQGCRFISLDSAFLERNGEGVEETYRWLEDCLADNPCTWTVIAHHQPLYSTAEGRNEVNHIFDRFKGLCQKYGVDLIMSAHDHQYSRFTEKKGNKMVTPVSIVSQAGGKCYIPLYNKNADRIGTALQAFQIVSVSAREMKIDVYLADGSLYDSIRIKNQRHGKKVIDNTPAVAEKTDLEYRVNFKSDKYSMNPEKEKETLKRREEYLER